MDLLRVINHHGARLATPIRTIQRVCSDPNLEIDPFDETIFTRSRAKGNHPFPVIDPPYKVKPSTIVKEEKDAKFDETLGSELKVERDKFASTWTASSSVKSKDRIKSASQAKKRNMDCDKASEKERVRSAENGTPSKQDGEKYASSSSSVSPSLEENIVLDAVLMGSKRTLKIDEEIIPSIPAESQEHTVQQGGSEPPVSKDKKDASG